MDVESDAKNTRECLLKEISRLKAQNASLINHLRHANVVEKSWKAILGDPRTGIPIATKAIEMHNIGLLKVILAQGYVRKKITPKPGDGTSEDSMVVEAVRCRHLPSLKLIIDHKANPNGRGDNYTRPLCLAVEKNFVSGVELLLKAQANVYQENRNQLSPLACAASKGYIEVLRVLLDHSSSMMDTTRPGELRGDFGWSWKPAHERDPLYLAIRGGHVRAVELLVKEPKHAIRNPCEYLEAAILQGPEFFKNIFSKLCPDQIEGGKDFESLKHDIWHDKSQSKHRNRMLCKVIEAGYLQPVVILLDHGFTPSFNSFWMSLRMAIDRPSPECARRKTIFELILNKNGKLYCSSSHQNVTPIMLCLKRWQSRDSVWFDTCKDVVQLLVEGKADVSRGSGITRMNETVFLSPFHFLLHDFFLMPSVKIAQDLQEIEKRLMVLLSILSPRTNIRMCFLEAILNNESAVVKYLVNRFGVDVEMDLREAVGTSTFHVLRKDIEKGAFGDSPLHFAIIINNLNCAQTLIDLGANINHRWKGKRAIEFMGQSLRAAEIFQVCREKDTKTILRRDLPSLEMLFPEIQKASFSSLLYEIQSDSVALRFPGENTRNNPIQEASEAPSDGFRFNPDGESLLFGDSGGFGDSVGGFGDSVGGFGDSVGGFGDSVGGFDDSVGGFGEL